MIRRQQRVARPRARTLAFAGLYAVMVAVGWTSVMIVAPSVHAGSTTPSPAPAVPTVSATPLAPGPSPTPSPTPSPEITPVPDPTRTAFDIDLYRPGTFVSQMNRDYCMAGAVQNMLNIIGPGIDLSTGYQQQIGATIVSLTTPQDSHNGGFGPGGWALTMARLGGGKYQLVVESTFDQAMKDAALSLALTQRPVGLLTWWGAHSWVMTGFRADSDPVLFPSSFKLFGAYIVDPFYPRVSDIWGQTLGPDTFRDMAAMAHNYIGWKRPEGHYPGRDGKWLLVIPVNA